MIILKEIALQNAKDLQKNIYNDKSINEIKNIILSWKTKTINDKYFEMFGVFEDEKFLGIVSLAEQTKSSVSIGIEIFEEFRNLGYGCAALNKALEKAKLKGYNLTINQVRIDNFASMALCEKCGLETNLYEYVNKKGNKVYLYIKQL